MIHAPVVLDHEMFSSKDRISDYFENVAAHSSYSDIAGFDLYPVPAQLAKLGGLLGIIFFQSGGEILVDARVLFLERNGERQHFTFA